jgi:hypothetical protein
VLHSQTQGLRFASGVLSTAYGCLCLAPGRDRSSPVRPTAARRGDSARDTVCFTLLLKLRRAVVLHSQAQCVLHPGRANYSLWVPCLAGREPQ